jgi:hypothetical protein
MYRVARPFVILVPLATLFCLSYGSALFHDEQFAYRDAGQFYYPLYQRVQAEWDAGRWPVWEPEENGGMPLLGNPTAAVLYPGKVVFALLPYPWAMRVYVSAHTLLAFGAVLAMMRSWGTSWVGSTLSALSYAFGAPILFQHSNIIFLVGAAWLPLGFRAADRWARLGRRWALLELAVVLAMQTLGGDPEASYVLGVYAAAYALALSRRGSPRLAPRRLALYSSAAVAVWVVGTLLAAHWVPGWRAQGPPRPLPWMAWFYWAVLAAWVVAGLAVAARRMHRGSADTRGTMLAGLAGSAVLAAALSAAQLVPVLEFTSRSLRFMGGGLHDLYAFSVEPARAVDVLWPNFYCEGTRHNRSWFEILPPSGKHAAVWVPSLYLGALGIVLGLASLGWRDGTPWRGWLTAVAVISLVASLGEYASPLWWARWVPAAAHFVGPHDPMATSPIRQDSFLRDGDGSPYWALATFLPGFRQFRYPAKLLAFWTLAICALAGLGWDRLHSGASRPAARLAACFLILTLAALAVATSQRDWIVRRLAVFGEGEPTSALGPLDAEGAFAEMRFALIYGAVALSSTLVLVVYGRRRSSAAGTIALALATADLALANTRHVLTAPQALFTGEPKVVRIIAEAERKDSDAQPFRVHRMPLWFPPGWLETGSADRDQDFFAWERDTIRPKSGLPFGVHYTLASGTTVLSQYQWFFNGHYRHAGAEVAAALGVRPEQRIFYQPRRAFDMWNTRYFVLPAFPNGWTDSSRAYAAFLEQVDRTYPAPDAFDDPLSGELRLNWIYGEDLQVFRNRAAYPRAWVVHQARAHRPGDEPDRLETLAEMLFPNDAFWNDPRRRVYDPRVVAWLDRDTIKSLAGYLRGAPPVTGESVTVARYDPQRVELEAVLNQPGLVVLADVDYPGWRLTIDGEPAAVYRVNLLMRGAAVGAGRHRLVYTYEPLSFYWGRWVSAAGMIVFFALAAFFRRCPISPVLAR